MAVAVFLNSAPLQVRIGKGLRFDSRMLGTGFGTAMSSRVARYGVLTVCY